VWLGRDVAAVGQGHEWTADEGVELVVAQHEVGLLEVFGVGADLLEAGEKLLLEHLAQGVDREVPVDRARPLSQNGPLRIEEPGVRLCAELRGSAAKLACMSGWMRDYVLGSRMLVELRRETGRRAGSARSGR
jgi:hypothetical protein